MNESLFDFVLAVFWKVLAATLTVVMLGWIGAMWFYGELKTVDIVGSLVSAPVFAYMVHLWVVYGKNGFARQGTAGGRLDDCGGQCLL